MRAPAATLCPRLCPSAAEPGTSHTPLAAVHAWHAPRLCVRRVAACYY